MTQFDKTKNTDKRTKNGKYDLNWQNNYSKSLRRPKMKIKVLLTTLLSHVSNVMFHNKQKKMLFSINS